MPHRASLYLAGLQLTRNVAEAEGLVQKTLIRAFTRWHTFRASQECFAAERGAARAWLHTIFRNLFFSDFQRQNRKGGPDISLDAINEDSGIAFQCSPLSSSLAMMTPEQAVMAKEEFLAVRRAIRRLPESHSAVLTMAVEEGLLYEEIAVRLNLPIGTVRSRLHRARQRVQRAVSSWRVGQDFKSGVQVGVASTPTFFLNGRRHENIADQDSLRPAIREVCIRDGRRDNV